MKSLKVLFFFAAALAAGSLFAETETVDGVKWTYQVEDGKAIVYNDEDSAISISTSGAITIPSMLGGCPVTSIGSHAFRGCSSLTSVTIPDGVTSIGFCAFSGCSGLTSVTIPSSVTSIELWAFDNSLYDTSSMPGIALVDGWAVGHTDALSGNLDLTGVRGIGEDAFSGCSGLTSVTIPTSVTSIGWGAFSGCSGLTGVTIPDGVTSIGEGAFRGCSGLTSVTIPDSVTSLSSTVFDGCEKLWTAWYKTLANNSASGGGSSSVVTTVVQQVESPYDLSNAPADHSIASVMVDSDSAIDKFVLKDGKVYDSVLRIENTAAKAVKLTLPTGYEYETFKGTKPLTIPASSRNILTITRTATGTFLVSRRELETVQ